jgi:hypothetical protein
MDSPVAELIVALVSAALGWFARHYSGRKA